MPICADGLFDIRHGTQRSQRGREAAEVDDGCFEPFHVPPCLCGGVSGDCLGRPDWKFALADGIKIPGADNEADFVCFFSVFTRLTREDTYRNLGEARRVLKPGGRIVFSFLVFHIYSHWTVFESSLQHRGRGGEIPLNQFLSRDAITAWAHHLDLTIEQISDGDKPHIAIQEDLAFEGGLVMRGKGYLGQSVAVLVKK